MPLQLTPRFLRDAGPSDMVELALPHHKPPTMGTPDVVPLVSLVQSLDAWMFLWADVTLQRVSRCVVVRTDASDTDWGAVCNEHAVSGLWMGPRLHWHIN